MKAIETVYNGYRFRSRLEARWAVFFDELGIEYRYEFEGYNLNGIRYLPDFWFPEQEFFPEGAWIEIKGQPPTLEEKEKALMLATETDKPVYIFYGNIGMKPEYNCIVLPKIEVHAVPIEHIFDIRPINYYTVNPIPDLPLNIKMLVYKCEQYCQMNLMVSNKTVELLLPAWSYGRKVDLAIEDLEKFKDIPKYLDEIKANASKIAEFFHIDNDTSKILLNIGDWADVDEAEWFVCQDCKKVHLCQGEYYLIRHACEHCHLQRNDEKTLQRAFDAARSARFEFGEKGR